SGCTHTRAKGYILLANSCCNSAEFPVKQLRHVHGVHGPDCAAVFSVCPRCATGGFGECTGMLEVCQLEGYFGKRSTETAPPARCRRWDCERCFANLLSRLWHAIARREG